MSLDLGGSVYFIADIGSNHDGSLDRARLLIDQAAKAGANAVKFQMFQAEGIASREGFTAIGRPELYEVYERNELPHEWLPELWEECCRRGVQLLCTAYDLTGLEWVDRFVSAHKVGSGDLTWHEYLQFVRECGKPVFLSTGGATLDEVTAAVGVVGVRDLVLMQCNLNYDAGEGLSHVNLNVLRTYATLWPEATLGFSDHTPGHLAVLGAVALGAKVVEKHFTLDKKAAGPDHGFALEPDEFRAMADDVRKLEQALGSPVKAVAPEEQAWRVIARRGEWGGRRLRPCPE